MQVIRIHKSMPDFFRITYRGGDDVVADIDFNYSQFFRERMGGNCEVEFFLYTAKTKLAVRRVV